MGQTAPSCGRSTEQLIWDSSSYHKKYLGLIWIIIIISPYIYIYGTFYISCDISYLGYMIDMRSSIPKYIHGLYHKHIYIYEINQYQSHYTHKFSQICLYIYILWESTWVIYNKLYLGLIWINYDQL